MLTAFLVLTACTQKRSATVAASTAPVLQLAITPAQQARNLPITTEIGISIANGTVSSVTVTGDDGTVVKGQMRPDGSSWVPDRALKPSTAYTATVSAGDVSQTTSFTTMANPANRVDTGLYMFDDQTYGVAMPVVVEFTQDVQLEARKSVESRLFIKTEPAQPGVWHWTGARQVTYRAAEYWKPGTVITVRSGLDGHPLGAGRYGDTDRRAVGHIAKDKVELVIDNATKQLTVSRDGTALKTIPVSLGKPSTPSSSGTMVIMEKAEHTVFDTTREGGPDTYRANIDYAQRLTWGGEFIHAAPWSVDDQGVRNVSHGCVNMSWGNAAWLFGVTRVGDPVTVKGTERTLEPGNGFTAWNLSWDEYVKGIVKGQDVVVHRQLLN